MQKKPLLTKELIKQVLDDITPSPTDRRIKGYIFFNNEQQAEDWLTMFHGLVKEEFERQLCDSNKDNKNEKRNYINKY